MESKFKYRTGNQFATGKIEKIEIVSETAHTVKFLRNGVERLEHKHSDNAVWHDSFDGAKNFLVAKFQRKIEHLEHELSINRSIIDTLNTSEPF